MLQNNININSSRQSTNQILMVRPAKFGFNIETALDNVFQQKPTESTTCQEIHQQALIEFDNFVKTLETSGVSVHVVHEILEEPNNISTDSIFPNNWISFHPEDSTLCIYPMSSPSRRLERKSNILQELENNFIVKTIIDLTRFENYNKFLEGTGSMVLDRENYLAYASISVRTDEQLFIKFCKMLDYKPIIFHAVDDNGLSIYHTNVLMSVCDKYSIICLESIRDEIERKTVLECLEKSGKVVIKLAYKQMNSFAGNMLQVKARNGKTVLVMSTQAYESLDFEQITKIEQFDPILHSDIKTIEAYGGGSVRCMMAEIFLSVK